MTANLIISNGYYTTLTALSVLKQLNIENHPKFLLAYFKHKVSDFTKNTTDVTKKVWNFDSLIDYNLYNNGQSFSFDSFNENFKVSNFDNILIPINSSTKKWYYGLKNYNNKANFIFYEEGLLSYIKPIFDLKLKKIIESYSCYFNDFNKNFLDLISNNIKNLDNTFNIIDIKFFKEALLDLKHVLGINFYDLCLLKTKNVIFLPQYYYNTNKQANISKYKDYYRIIEKLLLKGYKVLIKDHPKDNYDTLESFLNVYLKNDPNVVFLKNIQNYPVELFLNDLNINLLFSVYSTSLFSASSSIFNLPVFTSYKMLNKRIKSFSLYPSVSCRLTKEAVPDIESFLSYYSGNAKKYFQTFNKQNQNEFYKKNLYYLLIKFLFK